MTVKTTVSTQDIDEAFLRLKDIAKKHHYNLITTFPKSMIARFI